MSRFRHWYLTSRYAPWLLAALLTALLFGLTAAGDLAGLTRFWF